MSETRIEQGAIVKGSSSANLGSSTIRVPGASLFYEARGSGPVLLMIPGGPADAGIFAAIAPLLADRYTAVCYDPRGNSRSVLDGEPEDQSMDLHGDDAAGLIAAFGGEAANVLGSSGGAQIGLNLAARHPERVRALVAHEPPCMQLLPDAAEHVKFTEDVLAAYKSSGAGEAMKRFAAYTGLGGSPRPANAAPPSAEAQESFTRMRGNFDFFFKHGVKPISLFVPDVDTLKTGKPRIVVGVGETSQGQLAFRSAVALAGRLGTKPVVFPGGHTGYTEFPAEFAHKLHGVFESA